VGACVSVGLARVLPVLGVAIVTGIGIVLGLILLIVPGIILACMWYVAVPCAVVERAGVGDAMGRSSILTKGHKGSIFGIFVLIAILGYLLNWIVMTFLLGASPVVTIVVSMLVGALAYLYGGVCQAVAYHDLRVIKEGIGVEELIQAFE
jgi:uncharacterized membrane protein